MRIAYRLIATTVALGLALTHAPIVSAAPDDVETLYAEGDSSFANGDYVGAARAWGKALDLMEESDDTNSTRATILVSALSAYMEAFVETRKVEHLRAAARLLERYAESLEAAYNGEAQLSEAVIDMKRRLDNALESAEQEPGPTEPTSEPVDATPAGNPDPTRQNDKVHPPTANGRGFIIAGVALAAASLGTGSLTVIGAVQGLQYGQQLDGDLSEEKRDEITDAGNRANAMAIAGGVATPILLGAGIALLIVGSRRNAANLAVVPTWQPGYAGVGISGRF